MSINALHDHDLRRLTAEDWVAYLVTETPDSEALALLKQWLAEDPMREVEIFELCQNWKQLGRLELHLVSEEPESEATISRPWLRRFTLPMQMAATIVFFLVAGGWLFSGLWSGTTVYETALGRQQTVALADGSVINLNADSRISVQYKDDGRGVIVERGEALFSVAHDAERPFIINVGDGRVRAIGTHFNVNRKANGQVMVTLLDGSIEVSRSTDSNQRVAKILRSPGQQALFASDGRNDSNSNEIVIIDRDETAVQRTIAWSNGKLVFAGETLREALVEVNRQSVHQLRLQDNNAGRKPIYGVFNAGDWRSFATALCHSYGLTAVDKKEDETLLMPSKGDRDCEGQD